MPPCTPERPIPQPRRRGQRRNLRRITARGKTDRAFAAYVDLVEAGEHLTEQMSRQLATFNLSMLQFRVLATLLHSGPQYLANMSHRFHCTRQNISQILNSLERMGCVERVRGAASALARAADAQGGPPSIPPLPRFDRRIILLRLTKHGEDLIRYVFPKHAKVVKAEMRVLDGREQESLSRMKPWESWYHTGQAP